MLLSEDETPIVDKLAKKRPAAEFEEEGVTCAVGFALFYSFMRKFHSYMFHLFKGCTQCFIWVKQSNFKVK